MLRCVLFYVSFLLLSVSCTTTVKNTPRAESAEQEREMNKYLFEKDTLSPPAQNATFHTIEIKQMKFVPETLMVHKGDTVTWINNDMVTHDVTEVKSKAWTSSPLPSGASWKIAIDKNTDYYCSIHVVMKGRIEVQ